MLSAAVEAGVDDKAIGLQANWKDPGPLVLKYARKRKDLSVGMVRNLAAQLREQWILKSSLLKIEWTSWNR